MFERDQGGLCGKARFSTVQTPDERSDVCVREIRGFLIEKKEEKKAYQSANSNSSRATLARKMSTVSCELDSSGSEVLGETGRDEFDEFEEKVAE